MKPPRSLSGPRAFQTVYRSGHRARRDGITAYALHRGDDGPLRAGVAVDKGLIAVRRNRVRRRLRSALGQCADGSGFDVVVRGSSDLISKDFQVLVSDLCTAVDAARDGAR